MRIRKTREWLNQHAPGGRPDRDGVRVLRRMLPMILEGKWDRSHQAKIKRVHAGINSRGEFVGSYASQHKRKIVIFK